MISGTVIGGAAIDAELEVAKSGQLSAFAGFDVGELGRAGCQRALEPVEGGSWSFHLYQHPLRVVAHEAGE